MAASTQVLTTVLEVMAQAAASGPPLSSEEIAIRTGRSSAEVRAALRDMLWFDVPWVDGDVQRGVGLVWWPTRAGLGALEDVRAREAGPSGSSPPDDGMPPARGPGRLRRRAASFLAL